MTNLRLVQPAPDPERLTVEELLALLGPDKLNAIERKVKIMRETYHCPYTVKDYEAFKDTTFSFFKHYEREFYSIEINNPEHYSSWRNQAYNFVEQHLSNYQGGLQAAERNAITGRDGGMIAVIDALTDAIIKLHTEGYIRSVFFDRIARSDYKTRVRLVEELLKKYGQFLFPGEELMPAVMFMTNVEALIQSFAIHIHSIRREWRY